MIVALPNGLKADIGDDYESFYTIHEIFYLNSYGNLKIESSDFVLDCGAHIGLFTVKAARKSSQVVSVEPASSNFTLLLRNIALNALEKKVTPIKRIIAAKSGLSISLHLHHSKAWNRICSENSVETEVEIVESVSVDDLSDELDRRFDVLKIDIEGAELELLKGSQETLKSVRELVLEYHSERLLQECKEFLDSHGFDCRVVRLKRFGNTRWLLGYLLLNSRLLLHSKKLNSLKTTGDSYPKIGVLYARSARA